MLTGRRPPYLAPLEDDAVRRPRRAAARAGARRPRATARGDRRRALRRRHGRRRGAVGRTPSTATRPGPCRARRRGLRSGPARCASQAITTDVGAEVGGTVLEATRPRHVVTVDLDASAPTTRARHGRCAHPARRHRDPGTVASAREPTRGDRRGQGGAGRPHGPGDHHARRPRPGRRLRHRAGGVASSAVRARRRLAVPVDALLALVRGRLRGGGGELDGRTAGAPWRSATFADGWVGVTGDGVEPGPDVVPADLATRPRARRGRQGVPGRPAGPGPRRRVDLTIETGELRRHRRPVGLGQVDAAQHRRRRSTGRREGERPASPGTTPPTLSDGELSALRAREIGFVFQQFLLLAA